MQPFWSSSATNDPPTSAYTRLLALGVEDYLLNAALRSILAQRLARRLCPAWAAPHPEAGAVMERFGLHAFAERAGVAAPRLLDARGCEACGHTGYRGRTAVVEYLRCDEGIKALDAGPHFLADARRYCDSQGWRSLLEDGYLKALTGQTTIEEVLRVAG